jgi:hypothetical protein
MKKIILIIPFLAFLTLTNAQDLKNLRIGLMVSNSLLIPSSDNIDINSKASYDFDFGLSFDYFFTENYALNASAYMDLPFIFRSNGMNYAADTSFTTTNGKFVSSSDFGNKESITNMNLDIPISFKLKTNEIGYFRYFGDVGFVNTFRIQSRYSLADTDIQKYKFGAGDLEFTNVNYHTNIYDFSLRVGGGIEYTISDNTALVVGIYFTNGFLDYINDGDGQSSYMRKLSLRTGILF